MEWNDAELIQRILRGDQDAFGPLVRKYQKGVHALVWRKIGDFHIAQEITQDAFLNAYRKLRTLKNHNQFAGWLYVIAANLCRDWLRRKRLPTESIDVDETNEVDKVSYSKYLAEKQEADADETRREVVKKLLQKLPESERTVMTLHYLGEMTIKAISEFLGVSPNTVKSRLSRARNRLREEEDVIQQHLGSFQLPPQLTENILREAARITPIAPPTSKPMVPWVISATSAILIFIFAGVGTQYLSRFQEPYNLNAVSEPTVQVIDAVFIYDSPVKPAIRNQQGSSIAPGKGLGAGQKPEESLVATLPIDTTDVSMPKPQWTQAKGPEGAAINRLFAAANGDLYARTETDLYRLADDGSLWQLVNADLSTNESWHITEHDNLLYAVSDTEVLTSIDRGTTWDVLTTRPKGTLVDLAITDEAPGVQANIVMYLGLADGVFRSVDAGKSWTSVNTEALTGKKIQTITAIENSLFVGTDNGLYRRNSESWEQVLVGDVPKNIRALASAEHRLYVAVGSTSKNQDISSNMSMSFRIEDDPSLFLYRSTDLGNSWQALEDFMETITSDGVETAASDPLEGIKVTIGGQTEVTTELKMVAIQESLWVIDSAKSYYSNDSGETWVALNPDTSDVGVVSTIVPLDARTLYKSGQFGIYRTTDAGKTWHQFNTGLVKTSVLNLVSTHKGLYANTGQVLVISSDGGESWIPVPTTFTPLTSLAKFNDVIYARGHSGMSPQLFLLSAEDNGMIPVPDMPTLKPQTSEELKNAFLEAVPDDDKKNAEEKAEQNPKDLDIENYNEVIADSIAQFLQSLFGSFAVSGTTYYMESEGTLFRWKLGTMEWVDTGLVDEGPSIDSFKELADYGFIHASLAVSGKTVYIGKRDGHLFQSFDEGETWNNVTGELPFSFQHFKAVKFAGSTVYVATDAGVAYSNDGTYWHTAIDLEGTPIVIERFAVDGTTLYGTSEQRVYQVNENSGMWRQVAPEIPMPITSLAVDGNTLYVGTDGSGVLRFMLDESK